MRATQELEDEVPELKNLENKTRQSWVSLAASHLKLRGVSKNTILTPKFIRENKVNSNTEFHESPTIVTEQ